MSDFVFGWLGTSEVDVIPDALVHEVDADLQQAIQDAGAYSQFHIAAEDVEDQGR